MIRFALGTFLLAVPLAAQDTPLEAFHQGIAAIQAHDRAAYLSHYLQSPPLPRVCPDLLPPARDGSARPRRPPPPHTRVRTPRRRLPLPPPAPSPRPPPPPAPRPGRRPARPARARLAQGLPVSPSRSRPARTARALLPLLSVQRGHGGVRRGGISLDTRAAGAHRA